MWRHLDRGMAGQVPRLCVHELDPQEAVALQRDWRAPAFAEHLPDVLEVVRREGTTEVERDPPILRVPLGVVAHVDGHQIRQRRFRRPGDGRGQRVGDRDPVRRHTPVVADPVLQTGRRRLAGRQRGLGRQRGPGRLGTPGGRRARGRRWRCAALARAGRARLGAAASGERRHDKQKQWYPAHPHCGPPDGRSVAWCRREDDAPAGDSVYRRRYRSTAAAPIHFLGIVLNLDGAPVHGERSACQGVAGRT